MSIRAQTLIVVAWALGAAWILIPHRFEGPVVLVISGHYELGVHRTDPLGIILPALATVVVLLRDRDRP